MANLQKKNFKKKTISKALSCHIAHEKDDAFSRRWRDKGKRDSLNLEGYE